MNVKGIAIKIRAARHDRAETQQVIADKSGLDVRRICEIESGRTNYKIGTLLPVLKVLELQLRIVHVTNVETPQ